ncbi:hypothetical protein [Micromonospora sp. WMMD812]|nr:hypothetical protein [Micromonospora sp. WMMD812]WBB66089.1 hypothetical protein O7603_23365 [Micromonospora sp. WMMD812]
MRLVAALVGAIIILISPAPADAASRVTYGTTAAVSGEPAA